MAYALPTCDALFTSAPCRTSASMQATCPCCAASLIAGVPFGRSTRRTTPSLSALRAAQAGAHVPRLTRSRSRRRHTALARRCPRRSPLGWPCTAALHRPAHVRPRGQVSTLCVCVRAKITKHLRGLVHVHTEASQSEDTRRAAPLCRNCHRCCAFLQAQPQRPRSWVKPGNEALPRLERGPLTFVAAYRLAPCRASVSMHLSQPACAATNVGVAPFCTTIHCHHAGHTTARLSRHTLLAALTSAPWRASVSTHSRCLAPAAIRIGVEPHFCVKNKRARVNQSAVRTWCEGIAIDSRAWAGPHQLRAVPTPRCTPRGLAVLPRTPESSLSAWTRPPASLGSFSQSRVVHTYAATVKIRTVARQLPDTRDVAFDHGTIEGRPPILCVRSAVSGQRADMDTQQTFTHDVCLVHVRTIQSQRLNTSQVAVLGCLSKR